MPCAADLDESVIAIMAACADVPVVMAGDTLTQATLPARCDGVHIDLPTEILPLARAARLLEDGPAVRAAVAAWSSAEKPLEPKHFDGVDDALGSGLRGQLAERGVPALAGDGTPAPEGTQEPADPMRPEAPRRHLLSAFLRARADYRYAQLLGRSDLHGKARLRSASGRTAGQFFAAQINGDGVAMSDRLFACAVRWRFGVPAAGCPAPCRNTAVGKATVCPGNCSADGTHAVDCKFGPLVKRRHDALCELWAGILEEAGATVRREAFVPELINGKQEAWLDLWVIGTQECRDFLGDVIVRHPASVRFVARAAHEDGHSCAAAAEEKRKRYGQTNSVHNARKVVPLPHETWGRLGEEAEALLESAAASVTRAAARAGRATPVGCTLRRWRAKLDETLHRLVAHQLHAAQYGLPGTARRRCAPSDILSLEPRCALKDGRLAIGEADP